MPRVFKLPDLGEGIHEAEVVSVLVAAGDDVLEGQPILEVETDKARVEIPSPFTGKVSAVKVKPGEMVRVGTVLVEFDDVPGIAAKEGMAGDIVAASAAGRPAEMTPSALANDVRPGAPSSEMGQIATGTRPESDADRPAGPVPASPATRRLARELGVDLHRVPASGLHGLITAEDVRSFAAGRQKTPTEPVRIVAAEVVEEVPITPAVAPAGELVLRLPDFSRWGPVERVALRSVRRTTARRLALAWAQIPHVNHQDVVDITLLDELRHKHQEEIQALGGKLTLTVFVLKAVVTALKKFPRFNASLDPLSDEMILKHYYHLGVAVDSERGLLVPVVRDVEHKSLRDLAVELFELAERSRAGTNTPEDMQGGTFTITNIGALGGTGFAPIINYPQVAILGMGQARWQPKVMGEVGAMQIVPRLMVPLVLAFDHRLLDGADAARFMNLIIQQLEDPEEMLLMM
ncbi:MAG TPA: 2-oxo acid dehydrogenase subunit E2 [Syntrophobacteraceae bacterium]|nr:2-oxo acid dehydrogenase subunit E2 [Syntrophobacteraceae bacterium]